MKTFILTLILFTIANAQQNQLSLFGLTIHGVEVNRGAAGDMRNKITSDGILALNPQFNYTKVYEDNTMVNTSIVIDCYAAYATFLGYGKKYKIDNNFYLGYVAGLYSRIKPNRDESGINFPSIGKYQFIPIGGLYSEYKLTEKTSIRFTANYFINFIDLAFNF